MRTTAPGRAGRAGRLAAGVLLAGLGAGLGAGLLAGCTPDLANGPSSLPAGRCPEPGPGNAAIDYVPFVRLHGRMFSTGLTAPADPLPQALIGPQVGTVTCRLADTKVSPGFAYRDGDASYLAPGTALHRVVGYRDTFRLAAQADDGSWQLFELDGDDSARTGADLLDLSPGVAAVELVDVDSGEVLGAVPEPDRVQTLVAAVLAARAVPESTSRTTGEELRQLVRFRMKDGTRVERSWQRGSGYLGHQIVVPAELTATFPPT